MPPTPRTNGPKKKPNVKVPTASSGGGGSNKALLIGLGVVGIVILAAIGGYFTFTGSSSAATNAPKLLEAAGCTVQSVKSEKSNDHSVLTPTGTSRKWNTDPPTSGPHYAVPALWGSYTAPVNMAQLVHNLEHGGIYILYGKDVPDSTVEQLRSFYEAHKTGAIMAPLDRLGDKFALGAWVVDGDTHSGFLAKCTTFDENAASTFFRSLQFRGPERFDPSQLQPGM
jgi:hypothetical protein